MANSSRLQIIAIITLILGFLITPFPQAHGESMDYVKSTRIFITWGDTDDTVDASVAMQNWDGSLSLPGGNIVVIRPYWFKEDNDRVHNLEGESITFNSDIVSNMDGLYVRFDPTMTEQELVFETESGIKVTKDLGYFIDNKTYTYNVGDGMKVHFSRQFIDSAERTVDSFDGVTDTAVSGDSSTSSDSSDDAATTTTQPVTTTEKPKPVPVNMGYKNNEEGIRNRMVYFQQMKPFLGKKDRVITDPATLMLLSDKDLAALDKENLSQMNFSLLKTLPERLFDSLKEKDRNILSKLPDNLQTQASLLDGVFPESLRAKSGITDADEIAMWKQALRSLDGVERKQVTARLEEITPGDWTRLRDLSSNDLMMAMKFMTHVKQERLDDTLGLYISQLEDLAEVERVFQLNRRNFSTGTIRKISSLISNLRKGFIFETTNRSNIFKDMIDFFENSDDKAMEDLVAELDAIEAKLMMVRQESREAKFKDGLLEFKDVPDGQWYTSFVNKLSRDAVVSGYKDKDGAPTGSFGPADSVTVAETLKMMFEASELGGADGVPNLVQAINHWSRRYVKHAEDLNLDLLTSSSTTLDLNRPITRAEAIRAMFEILALTPPNYDESSFSDVAANDAFQDFIEYARDLDVISGDDTSATFRPNSPLNRAEMTKIVTNMMEYLVTPFEE